MPAPEPVRQARRAGLVTFGVVQAVAFFWVDSEWKGGWVQGLAGAALLAIPSGLIVWGIRAAPASTVARVVVKSLLVATVLLSLAGIHSYGIFTTPWLLAPLWIAARRAGPLERYIWIGLTAPCALLVGLILSSHFEDRVAHLPTSVTTLVVLLFWLSTRDATERSCPSHYR